MPILISHLFQQCLFSSWPLLFLHLGCFGLDSIVKVIVKSVFCCCEGKFCQEKLSESCDLLINRYSYTAS